MFTVYVIQNQKTGKIYIGQTKNLEQRLLSHNGKFVLKTTAFTKKNAGSWNCVYTEVFETRAEALKREKELKSSRGRQFVREQIMGQ